MKRRRATREEYEAAKLYRAFREAAPRKARRVTLSIPRALAVMGVVDAIDYTTTHQGRTERYRHTFKPGSKPLLCAGTGEGQLFLLRGRFRVTSRGIVDLNGNRREQK